MVLSGKNPKAKVDEFFFSAVHATLKNLLKPEDALFLTKALVSGQSKDKLVEFLQSPIIVINGENNVLVDNKFLKRQLLEKDKIDILEQLDKAKIIVCNCSNISIKGLDVIYLLSNTVRLLSPEDEQTSKSEVFLAQNNKIINTINANISFSIGNSFKTLLHASIDKMKNTRILHATPTCKIPEMDNSHSREMRA